MTGKDESESKRRETIQVYVSSEEKKAIKRKADSENRSISNYVRNIVLREE